MLRERASASGFIVAWSLRDGVTVAMGDTPLSILTAVHLRYP